MELVITQFRDTHCCLIDLIIYSNYLTIHALHCLYTFLSYLSNET